MRLEADSPSVESSSGPAAPFSLRELVLRARSRAALLFAPAARRSVTPSSVLVSAGFIAVTATYSLLRVGGAGAFNSIWAEDGALFLSDAYMLPVWHTILRPINGYFLVLPRLMAEVAGLFPVGWGPAVLSSEAALFSAAMAVMVYAASGNILHRPFPRFVAAFWVVAAPLAESTHTFGPNMVAPLQFVELYGLFWALLWTPARPWARVVRFTFAVACCLSTFLAVLFLPLALLRIWACRDRASVWLASVLAAGGAFQTAGLVLGVSSRGGISHPRLDPLWALVSFADWGLPFGVAGEKIMRDPGFNEPGVHSGGGGAWYWAGVVVTWLIVLAVLAVALRRTTSPYWLFAAVAWSEAVLLLCAQIVIQGRLELRYAYAPAMIVVAALLALLRPRTLPRHAPLTTKAATWLPVLALVCVLAVSAAVNYRTWTTRSLAVPWSTKVAESTAICRADRNAPFVVTFTVDAWFVVIPCRLLR